MSSPSSPFQNSLFSKTLATLERAGGTVRELLLGALVFPKKNSPTLVQIHTLTSHKPTHSKTPFAHHTVLQCSGVLPALPTPTSRLGAEAGQKYSGKEGGGRRTPQRVGPLRFCTNPLPRYRCARDPDRDWSANGRPRTVL